MKLATRIAPTPSGFLHRGNIFSFLLTAAIADKFDGTVRLRIDDLDTARSKREFLEDIFETLRFLNIRYEEGPLNAEDFYLHFSQKHRVGDYYLFLGQPVLKDLLYACTCSRKDLVNHHANNFHRCGCRERKLPLDTHHAAWRIYVPDSLEVLVPDVLKGQIPINLFKSMGDFIVRRRDGIASYQVSSLVDDLGYGINYVVRGKDLLESTAAQLYLADITSSDRFLKCCFLHHPLITDGTGVKLSKSAGSNSIKHMREFGLSREDIVGPINEKIIRLLRDLEGSFK